MYKPRPDEFLTNTLCRAKYGLVLGWWANMASLTYFDQGSLAMLRSRLKRHQQWIGLKKTENQQNQNQVTFAQGTPRKCPKEIRSKNLRSDIALAIATTLRGAWRQSTKKAPQTRHQLATKTPLIRNNITIIKHVNIKR